VRREAAREKGAFLSQRILAVPQAYAGRILGLTDAHEASQILRQAMIELLDELKDLPDRVTDPTT
jgi:hypothetical protein